MKRGIFVLIAAALLAAAGFKLGVLVYDRACGESAAEVLAAWGRMQQLARNYPYQGGR